MHLNDFLHQTFLGNTYGQYLLAAGILLVGGVFRRLVSKLLGKLLFAVAKRYTAGVSEAELHDLLVQPLAGLVLVFTLLAASTVLIYPHEGLVLATNEPQPWHQTALLRLLHLAFIVAGARVALRVADLALLVVARRAALHPAGGGNGRLGSQFLPFANDLLQVFIVIVALLLALGEVFGVNVAALVGGLGIGGLAVAFAAKETLENLIASFTIFLDQPFGVGDLVKVGEVNGTVEKVGFRSTRLRTAEKSYLTVPNKSMIDKPLDNLTLRTARRVGFTLVFGHATTSAQLQTIIAAATAAIAAHPLVSQNVQIKFNALVPAGKEVTVEYFIETTSYAEYINTKEELNYAFVEATEQAGGVFAGVPAA